MCKTLHWLGFSYNTIEGPREDNQRKIWRENLGRQKYVQRDKLGRQTEREIEREKEREREREKERERERERERGRDDIQRGRKIERGREKL